MVNASEDLYNKKISPKVFESKKAEYQKHNPKKISNLSELDTITNEDFSEKKVLKEFSKFRDYDILYPVNDEREIIEKSIQKIANEIQERTGMSVSIINDVNKKFKGYYENGKSVINLAYATLDTPIHEMLAHPFIDDIKYNNKELYDNLVNEFKNNKKDIKRKLEVINKVQSLYPELSEEEVIEEALVTYLGEVSAEKFKQKEEDKSIIQKVLSKFKDFISKIFRVNELNPNTTIEDISELFGIADNKLLFEGFEYEYTTPDGKTFNNKIDAQIHLDNTFKPLDSQENIPSDTFKKYHKNNRYYVESKKRIDSIKRYYPTFFNYDIDDFYSRGGVIEHIIQAYQNDEIILEESLDNLLMNIKDHESLGSEFMLSAVAYTNDRPSALLSKRNRQGNVRVRIHSGSIKWATNVDARSGSVFNAKSLLGTTNVSYLKYPHIDAIENVVNTLDRVMYNNTVEKDNIGEVGVAVTIDDIELVYNEKLTPKHIRNKVDKINKELEKLRKKNKFTHNKDNSKFVFNEAINNKKGITGAKIDDLLMNTPQDYDGVLDASYFKDIEKNLQKISSSNIVNFDEIVSGNTYYAFKVGDKFFKFHRNTIESIDEVEYNDTKNKNFPIGGVFGDKKVLYKSDVLGKNGILYKGFPVPNQILNSELKDYTQELNNSRPKEQSIEDIDNNNEELIRNIKAINNNRKNGVYGEIGIRVIESNNTKESRKYQKIDTQEEYSNIIKGNTDIEISASDPNFYIDKNSGKTYKRVTSFTKTGVMENRRAVARGTIMDGAARQYLMYLYDNGVKMGLKQFISIFRNEEAEYINDLEKKIQGFTDDVKKKNVVYKFTDKAISEFYNLLKVYEGLAKNGTKFMANTPTMYGRIKSYNEDGSIRYDDVAGTADVIYETSERDVDGIKRKLIGLIDFKTTTSSMLHDNTIEKYSFQQNVYAELFRQRTGKTIDYIMLQVFKVTENHNTGEITSVSKYLDGKENKPFIGLPINRNYLHKANSFVKSTEFLKNKYNKSLRSLSKDLNEIIYAQKELDITNLTSKIHFLRSRIKNKRNKNEVEQLTRLTKNLEETKKQIKLIGKRNLNNTILQMKEDIEKIIHLAYRIEDEKRKGKITTTISEVMELYSSISLYQSLDVQILRNLKENDKTLNEESKILLDALDKALIDFQNQKDGMIITAFRSIVESELANDEKVIDILSDLNDFYEQEDENGNSKRIYKYETLRNRLRNEGKLKKRVLQDKFGNRLIDDAGNPVEVQEEYISLDNLIYVDTDLSWREMMTTGVSEGNDSYIQQYIFQEMNKHFAVEQGIVKTITDKINALSKQLDDSIINSLFREDSSLIDEYSSEWYDSVSKEKTNIYTKLVKTKDREKKIRYTKELINWFKKNTDVINPFLLRDIVESYTNEEGVVFDGFFNDSSVGHFFDKSKIDDNYRDELIKRVGVEKYREIVENFREQIMNYTESIEMFNKIQDQNYNEYDNDVQNDQQKKKDLKAARDRIFETNVLFFLDKYFKNDLNVEETIEEGDGKFTGLYNDFSSNITSSGLQFIPKENFSNKEYNKIINDNSEKGQIVKELYANLRKAGEYMNNAYNLKTYGRIYVPLFKKNGSELIGVYDNIREGITGDNKTGNRVLEAGRGILNGVAKLFGSRDTEGFRDERINDIRTNLPKSYQLAFNEFVKALQIKGFSEEEAKVEAKKQLRSMYSDDYIASMIAGLELAGQHKARTDVKDKALIFTDVYNTIHTLSGEKRERAMRRHRAYMDSIIFNSPSDGKIDEKRVTKNKKTNKRSYSVEEIKAIKIYKDILRKLNKDKNYLENNDINIEEEIGDNFYKLQTKVNPDGVKEFMFNNQVVSKEDFKKMYNEFLEDKISSMGLAIEGITGFAQSMQSLVILKGMGLSISGGIFNNLEGTTTNLMYDKSGIYWKPGAIEMGREVLSGANLNKYFTDAMEFLNKKYN